MELRYYPRIALLRMQAQIDGVLLLRERWERDGSASQNETSDDRRSQPPGR